MRFRIAWAAAVALWTMTGTATADMPNPLDLYVSGSAGYMMPADVDGTQDGITFDQAFDGGAALNAAVGYDFGLLRGELEGGYGSITAGGASAGGTSYTGTDITLWTASINAYADFDWLPILTPYAGGGIGLALMEGDDSQVLVRGQSVTISSTDDASLMVHGEVGTAIWVAPLVSIVPAYRYMWVDGSPVSGGNDLTAHIGKVGLRIGF